MKARSLLGNKRRCLLCHENTCAVCQNGGGGWMFSSNDSDGDYCRMQRAGLFYLLDMLLLRGLRCLALLLGLGPHSRILKKTVMN
jgi:hypothetical protein